MSGPGKPQSSLQTSRRMNSGSYDPEWQAKSRSLKRDGSIMRYKLGTPYHSYSSRQPSHNPLRLTPPPGGDGNQAYDSEQVVQSGKPSLVLVKRDRDKDQDPKMPMQIGGLREDPFRMFPIEHNRHVASAFDYYTVVYVPTVMPTLLGDFYSITVPTLLQQPLRFEAYIAFALLMQRLHHCRDSRNSTALLYHLNRATANLRQRLLEGKEAISDEVIMTIAFLIAIAHLTNNLKAWEAHVHGLKHVVALRGGAENIVGPFSRLVKLAISNCLASWAARQKSLEYKQPPFSGERKDELSYPKHPFPPHLCEKIARFSTGFRELALSRVLSLQFIEYLFLTVVSTHVNGEKIVSVSTTADDVLGMSALTTLERLLGIALTTYNIHVEDKFCAPNVAYKFYVQRQFAVLTARPDFLVCDLDSDVLEWVCLIFTATTRENTDMWRWADARLRVKQPSESRQRVLGQAFLPIPQVT